jgi:hypothetical protein
MRRLVVFWIPVISLALGSNQALSAKIYGSPHDFSKMGWAGGEICPPCHTPHDSGTPVAGPLWNHEASVAPYILYNSPTLDDPIDRLGSVSKLCLSCHDGLIAIDSFGGNTGTTSIVGDVEIEINILNDHPIGVIWDHRTVRNNTASSFCSQCHVTMSVASSDMPLPFFEDDLAKPRLECATCHDPHNHVPDGNEYFLRITKKDGSLICFYCHDK